MSRYYFPAVSFVVLVLSVWGFSDNLFYDVGQATNRDPKFVVHGIFCLCWMILFFVQACLIRKGRAALHRRLGIAGLVVAVGVTVSTVYVFVEVWTSWASMEPYVKANRLLLPGYSLGIAAAFYYRRRPDVHKRLMTVATLFMLEPVLSRAFDPIEPLFAGMPDSQIDEWWLLFAGMTWILLFLSLWLYDLLTRRRPHAATVLGSAWFVGAMVIAHL